MKFSELFEAIPLHLLRRCSVCRNTKKILPGKRMCAACASLTPAERKQKVDSFKKPLKKTGSVRTVSGGLPSLGKRR